MISGTFVRIHLPVKLHVAITTLAMQGLLLLLLIGSEPLFAQTTPIQPISLYKLGPDLRPNQWLHAIEDPQHQLSIRDFLYEPTAFNWQPLTSDTPNFGYASTVVWLKFAIENTTTSTQTRLLSVAYPVLDQVDLFLLLPHQIIQHTSTGDFVPANSRHFQHRDFIFELQIPPQSKTEAILRIQTQGSIQVPLSFWKEKDFFAHDAKIQFLEAGYFGLMLVMFLFNILVYFNLKERSYLYYSAFVFSFVTVQIVLTGYAAIYLWPESWRPNQTVLQIFIPLTYTASILFGAEYLRTKQRLPKIHYGLMGLALVNFLILPSALFVSYQTTSSVSAMLLPPSTLIWLLLGPYLWIKGVKDARLFTLAWSTLIIGAVLFSLDKLALLPRNFITENAMLIGSAMEVLLLTLALTNRYNRERKQRYVIQREKLDEVRKRQSMEAAILHRSLHTKVTDLPNRTHLIYRLEELLLEDDNHCYALVLIQLGRFHEINKTLGHSNADKLLKHIADETQKTAAKSPYVVKINQLGQCLAHPEGVNFALILNDRDRTTTRDSIEQLHELIDKPFEFNGLSLDLNASVGVSYFPEHARDPESLLRHALIAIDIASEHANNIAEYSKDIDPYNERRLTLMAELLSAIDNEELELFYQPQIDLTSGAVYGAEALIRWNHPQHGFIPPDEFIPLAERTGVIKKLTMWVIDTALSFVKSHIDSANFCISVNISARNLLETHFDTAVKALLEKYGIDSQCLLLEVTETSVMQDTVNCLQMLDKLYQIGVKLSVDDFGTGQSSLSYVKRLPVHEIKIDRSFIMNMDTNSQDQVIVETTINMCHALGYLVVAEGVENEIILEKLAAIGCDYAMARISSRFKGY